MDPGLKLDGLPSGLVFCLKNVGKPVNREDGYALAPYYLTYVSEDGPVNLNFVQSKKILDVLKKHGHGKGTPDTDAIARMDARTKGGKDMSYYRDLLETAVGSIIGKSEENGV